MEEILNAIALTRISGFGGMLATRLYNEFGSATEVFANADNFGDIVEPQFAKRLQKSIADHQDEALHRAEKEIEFAEKGRISCITMNSPLYPSRLLGCDDAPIVIYYRGTADLNAQRILSVVGTRRCTEYGKEICRTMMNELSQMCPGTLIVSGLAYGIDINAHRESLRNNLPTVGVLAHGLNQIYPSHHRQTAAEMTQNGGLLTEFMSDSFPDRGNFVRRNRIVAGMSDACIVVESADKGGSLITARLASDYNRDVFAFPGRSTDQYSQGCNRLIEQNKAALVQSAADIIKALCWDARKIEPVQRELFPQDLPEDEARIVKCLDGTDGKQINTIAVELNIPVSQLSALLFSLEMKGIVKALIGGKYKLC